MADQEAPRQSAPQGRGTQDLTSGPVAKTLFFFALPALAVNIIQVLNGTIASIFVGQMLGEHEFAATSIAQSLMFVIFSVVIGFAMAATILVGQAMGRGDIFEVRRITGASIGLFAIGGVVIALLGWIFMPAILGLMATPETVLPHAIEYMRAFMFVLPISIINALLPSLLRGAGDAISPLWATVVNIIVSLIAFPLCIGWWGLSGAALAGLAANLASVLYQIIHVYRADLPVRLRGAEIQLLKPDWLHAKPLVTLGFPLGLSMLVMGVSQMGMQGLINREGEYTIAAFGAINQIWGFLQMPSYAVSMAVSAMAAQNIGAGKWDRINQIAMAGIGINFLMAGALVVVITLLQLPLLGIFLPAGSKAIPIGAHIGLLLNWTHIFLGVSTIVTSIVRANGAVVMPLIILFCTAVIMRFSIGFGGYETWGADAIWAAFAVHAVVATLWSLHYYRYGDWRSKSLNTGNVQPVGAEETV